MIARYFNEVPTFQRCFAKCRYLSVIYESINSSTEVFLEYFKSTLYFFNKSFDSETNNGIIFV